DESESSYAQKLIDTPSLANWLAPEGSFWVEERSSVTLTLSDTSSLVCVDKRKYGSSALWHFRRK
ncbi:MAG: hypothetical protein KDK40_04075, partial [Chlamydiia bacterium]|nr:hypothetical protein [Chlamydiia bacterium]